MSRATARLTCLAGPTRWPPLATPATGRVPTAANAPTEAAMAETARALGTRLSLRRATSRSCSLRAAACLATRSGSEGTASTRSSSSSSCTSSSGHASASSPAASPLTCRTAALPTGTPHSAPPIREVTASSSFARGRSTRAASASLRCSGSLRPCSPPRTTLPRLRACGPSTHGSRSRWGELAPLLPLRSFLLPPPPRCLCRRYAGEVSWSRRQRRRSTRGCASPRCSALRRRRPACPRRRHWRSRWRSRWALRPLAPLSQRVFPRLCSGAAGAAGASSPLAACATALSSVGRPSPRRGRPCPGRRRRRWQRRQERLPAQWPQRSGCASPCHAAAGPHLRPSRPASRLGGWRCARTRGSLRGRTPQPSPP
mmetsp:Transcript_33680/g.99897  ORF Transcript_33680/g.99897 Transcript_33680/m.99897 type:complete len:371 (+) Transcript_33680:270-1382(+)